MITTLVALSSIAHSLPTFPPNPMKNKNCEEIRTDEVQDYRKLVQKVAIYGKDDREYTDAEYTRATMKLFCIPKNGKKDINGKPYALRVGSASLTGPNQLSLSSHTITSADNCKVFRDLDQCFAQDISSKEYFKLMANTVQGKPNCMKSVGDVGKDEVKIQIATTPRGVRPYEIGDATLLKEGEEITVVATQAYNFHGGDNNRNERIIQKCKILRVENRKNRFRTDCDTGVWQSGAVALNSRGEAVGLLGGDFNVGDPKISPNGFEGLKVNPDGLDAEVNTNYSVFTMISKGSPPEML